MIKENFLEKVKILQSAFKTEKNLRLSLEQRVRKLIENNTYLTAELRKKVLPTQKKNPNV